MQVVRDITKPKAMIYQNKNLTHRQKRSRDEAILKIACTLRNCLGGVSAF